MPTSTHLAVDAHGLVKKFGAFTAVDGVDLQVHQGEIFGVLGPNGAGKTTTLKMLATLLAIDAGDATIFGVENGPPETQFHGVEGARAMYEMSTRLYEDDGTPKTKHITTNAIIEVDEEAGTATSRSYFCVVQATPALPLQPIVAGRYHDTFTVVDGSWVFATRTLFVDLAGDLSHHLKW